MRHNKPLSVILAQYNSDKPMAKKTGKKTNKTIAAFTYDDASRKNIPTAEFQSVMDRLTGY